MHMDGGKKAKKWRNFEEEKRLQSPPMYLKEEAAAAMWRNSRRHCHHRAAAGAGNTNTLFDGSSGKKAPLSASPLFLGWLYYVEVCILSEMKETLAVVS